LQLFKPHRRDFIPPDNEKLPPLDTGTDIAFMAQQSSCLIRLADVTAQVLRFWDKLLFRCAICQRRQASPYPHRISGAKATVSRMFINDAAQR
jgi:hypothetical protein